MSEASEGTTSPVTGSGSGVVSRSSAVPVLPATFTPGSAAAVPVPLVTTARM